MSKTVASIETLCPAVLPYAIIPNEIKTNSGSPFFLSGRWKKRSREKGNAMQEIRVAPGADLQAVLDRAEPGAVLRLSEGVYRQKLLLKTPGLNILGEGADRTVLLNGDYAKKLDKEGREYNTFRTWTLAVCADGVTMRGLSVVNDALDPAEKGQEVALSVYGDAFYMEDCVLRSTQDTLFLGPLPDDLIDRYEGFLPDELRKVGKFTQRFERCRIEGSVDFIFGCGEAAFTDCDIVSVFDGRGIGFVAAPAHELRQDTGFLFRSCRFTAGEGVADGTIFLARPWRDYGLCRFEECSYGSHIRPEGFDPWRDSGRDRTARFYESPAVPGRVNWVRQSF